MVTFAFHGMFGWGQMLRQDLDGAIGRVEAPNMRLRWRKPNKFIVDVLSQYNEDISLFGYSRGGAFISRLLYTLDSNRPRLFSEVRARIKKVCVYDAPIFNIRRTPHGVGCKEIPLKVLWNTGTYTGKDNGVLSGYFGKRAPVFDEIWGMRESSSHVYAGTKNHMHRNDKYNRPGHGIDTLLLNTIWNED